MKIIKCSKIDACIFSLVIRCEPGLIPKPDTITGCGPECVRDPDCRTGYVCQNQRCVEKPDPCNPSPCGPGAVCMVNSVGNPICRYSKCMHEEGLRKLLISYFHLFCIHFQIFFDGFF